MVFRKVVVFLGKLLLFCGKATTTIEKLLSLSTQKNYFCTRFNNITDNENDRNRTTHFNFRWKPHHDCCSDRDCACHSIHPYDDMRLPSLSRKSLEKEIQFRRFRQARTILYLYTDVLPSFGRFGIVVTKTSIHFRPINNNEKKVSIIIHPRNRSGDVYCL